ncbi:MAG: DUF4111 domain-containing protein [bacterium]|nr:DUF4111 domain-containing protein [bacterium]
MDPTPFADANELLAGLLGQMKSILGRKLIGLYLFGSLTTGDFDPGVSDVDLLAVTSTEIDPSEFEALSAMHGNCAHDNPDWEDRVEVLYKSVEGLRTFRSRTSPITAISPGEEFHLKSSGPDYLMNWYLVREQGIALFGPPPGSLIEPIAREEFIDAVRKYAIAFADRVRDAIPRKEQAYTILTLCRALYAHTLGEHVSKRRAAAWASEEIPEYSELIQRALTWRDAWREEPVEHAATLPETVAFVDLVIARINA